MKNGVIDHIDGVASNNTISNLRLVNQSENCKNTRLKTTNTSGTTGVAIVCNSKGVQYWRASWMEKGRFRSRCFNIQKLGNDTAFYLATKYRYEQITRLNYSERHGK